MRALKGRKSLSRPFRAPLWIWINPILYQGLPSLHPWLLSSALSSLLNRNPQNPTGSGKLRRKIVSNVFVFLDSQIEAARYLPVIIEDLMGARYLNHKEVFFLGTIHRLHLITSEYTLGHVKAAYLAIRPELLLVEIRPEEMALGNLSDGPFEMTYLTVLARKDGIPVEGIDWFTSVISCSAPDPEMVTMMDSELDGIMAGDKTGKPPSYREVHSTDYILRTMKSHEVRIRYLGDVGNGEWARRNLWMAHRVLKALDDYDVKRVMLAVGGEHLGTLISLFERDEKISCHLAPPVTPLLPSDYAASDDIVSAWKEGVHSLQIRIDSLDPDSQLRSRLKSKQKYFQIAIERRGIASPGAFCSK
jgi:hypothetical protein